MYILLVRRFLIMPVVASRTVIMVEEEMNKSGMSRILAPMRFVVILPFSPQCFIGSFKSLQWGWSNIMHVFLLVETIHVV